MRGSLAGSSAAAMGAWASWIAAGAPGLPGCSGTAAAAAARLRLAAALLPCLPAAQQLLSLHGKHASSTWAHPAAAQPLSSSFGSLGQAAAAAPKLTHSGGLSSGGRSPSRQHYAAAGTLGSAAQQLVSLRAFRGTAAEQRMWGSHWDKRHIYGSSRADALGVVVSALGTKCCGSTGGSRMQRSALTGRGRLIWQRRLIVLDPILARFYVQEKLHDEVPVVVPASHQRHLWEVRQGWSTWAALLLRLLPPLLTAAAVCSAAMCAHAHSVRLHVSELCCPCQMHAVPAVIAPAHSQTQAGAGVPARQHLPGDVEVAGCDGTGA